MRVHAFFYGSNTRNVHLVYLSAPAVRVYNYTSCIGFYSDETSAIVPQVLLMLPHRLVSPHHECFVSCCDETV